MRIWGSTGNIYVDNPWFPGGKPGDKSAIRLNRNGADELIECDAGAGLYTNEVDIVAKYISRREAPSPCMTYADSLGNQRALDAWRAEIGLKWDGETTTALQMPVSRRPLARRKNIAMQYGRIEGIVKEVSRLVIGSMIVHDTRLPFSFSLLDNFFENGGNAIDTAARLRRSSVLPERGVGKWIQATRCPRRRCPDRQGWRANITFVTPEQLDREMAGVRSTSWETVDYVDMYMMHRDNRISPLAEFVDFLNGHREAGTNPVVLAVQTGQLLG